jgi:competence protein ComEC
MAGLPPVARLAVVFVAGSALFRPGALLLAPVLVFLITLPIRASRRPDLKATWLLVALAGVCAGLAQLRADGGCDVPRADGLPAQVSGRLLAEGSRSLPFRVEAPSACRSVIRIQGAELEPGRLVTLTGRWREWSGGFTLNVDSAVAGASGGPDPRGALIRWRGHLVRRLHALYPGNGGLVAGLVLARKEGLDGDVREAFARTGIAHLLAISGFHVGVVAGILLAAVRWAGVSRRRAGLSAAAGAWAYVAFIGFPSAACRAALILTFTALSRARGRPPARFAPLGAALLVLVLWDPAGIGNVGFQLSFAGAGALVLWAGRVGPALQGWTGGKLPTALAGALGAGVAATAGTLPIVAWHFERVSLVGIPATLAASPLVVLALPGALASLLLDALSPRLGLFLAGGVSLLLDALTSATGWVAGHGWASVWVPRGWVPVAAAGAYVGLATARSPRIRPQVRRSVAMLLAVGGVVAWPLLQGLERSGRLELLVLDVGQGDALALRTPEGRWILVDAGPPARSPDAGGHPTVRALRRRGVTRLELMVLTHPDLDHIGGASAVLGSFAVGLVLDPGLPAGKGPFLETLETAAREDVPWAVAAAGQRYEVDGVSLEVLHPLGATREGSAPEANEASVVLHVRYGAFDALLLGDAPASVERALAPGLGGEVEVLKVAHHGSDTSTDSLLLARARPEVALISVGRGNRYGHPSPGVVARLRSADVTLYRTDRQGMLEVHARRDGGYVVRAATPRGR